MAVVNVESLLKPLTPEAPCGENLRWDRRFLEVDRLAEGKEGDQFGKVAEEPDWREVRDGCAELFARGKHLKVSVLLILAAVRMEGYPGLRDGLALVRGLLEQFWDQIYPQLDAEDNNDPTERVNSLSPLATPIATFGDKLKLQDRIQEAPICESRQLGKFSLRDVAIAAGTLEVPDDPQKPKPTLAIIDAAFEETDKAKLEEIAVAAEQAGESLEAIEKIFTDKCGPGIGPQLEPLKIMIRDAALQVRRHLGGPAGDAAAAEGGGGGGGAEGGQLKGDVGSPAEALLALDKVCRYYQANEPSSPVTLLVLCAQRMVNKNFQEIVKILPADLVSRLEEISSPPQQ